MRIALGIEYDGSHFCGWQYQDHSPSVQAGVEAALAEVANAPVRVICAGRTDTGVHALNQVVHFDTEVNRSERAWVFGSNTNLPKGVVVLWARVMDDSFHARFSATRRRYRYVIFNRNVRPTFLVNRVTWEYRALDVEPMQLAANHLLGKHDFNAYRAAACQAKSSVREIYSLEVKRQQDLVIIDVEANAFLHHMVRNIAGVLMAIGAGEKPPGWSKDVLMSKDRVHGGVTAPPYGLYLMDVDYEAQYQIPKVENSQSVW